MKNLDCLLYLQNGQTEGAHHTNRLGQAPAYAEQIHTSLQKRYRLVSLFLILMGIMSKLLSDFSLFPNGWLKNGKSNKELSLGFAKGLFF